MYLHIFKTNTRKAIFSSTISYLKTHILLFFFCQPIYISVSHKASMCWGGGGILHLKISCYCNTFMLKRYIFILVKKRSTFKVLPVLKDVAEISKMITVGLKKSLQILCLIYDYYISICSYESCLHRKRRLFYVRNEERKKNSPRLPLQHNSWKCDLVKRLHV